MLENIYKSSHFQFNCTLSCFPLVCISCNSMLGIPCWLHTWSVAVAIFSSTSLCPVNCTLSQGCETGNGSAVRWQLWMCVLQISPGRDHIEELRASAGSFPILQISYQPVCQRMSTSQVCVIVTCLTGSVSISAPPDHIPQSACILDLRIIPYRVHYLCSGF